MALLTAINNNFMLLAQAFDLVEHKRKSFREAIELLQHERAKLGPMLAELFPTDKDSAANALWTSGVPLFVLRVLALATHIVTVDELTLLCTLTFGSSAHLNQALRRLERFVELNGSGAIRLQHKSLADWIKAGDLGALPSEAPDWQTVRRSLAALGLIMMFKRFSRKAKADRKSVV